MAEYKLRNHTIDGVTHQDILWQLNGSNIAIPKDTLNRDYKRYLDWGAAGNTPEAAD